MSKYIDAEKLIAEIERLNNKYKYLSSVEAKHKTDCYADLLSFINSLPEDEPSEDLEDEIKKFFMSRYRGRMNFGELNGHYLENETIRMLVELGAEWQKERMMGDKTKRINARITRDIGGQVIFELPDNSDSGEFILLRKTTNLPIPTSGKSTNVEIIIIKEN